MKLGEILQASMSEPTPIGDRKKVARDRPVVFQKLCDSVDLSNVSPSPNSEERAVRVADVEPVEVPWLWKPYIPMGKLTILQGRQGEGKSWLTCRIAADFSRGVVPGGGAQEKGPTNVLLFSSEDGIADTIRPRLEAMGADLERVFVFPDPLTLDQEGLARIAKEIKRLSIGFVVFDPIQAYLGGKVDAYRANEVRPILQELARIAERLKCTILVVMHTRKSAAGGHAVHAGLGSVDFTAAARSVLLQGLNL